MSKKEEMVKDFKRYLSKKSVYSNPIYHIVKYFSMNS